MLASRVVLNQFFWLKVLPTYYDWQSSPDWSLRVYSLRLTAHALHTVCSNRIVPLLDLPVVSQHKT